MNAIPNTQLRDLLVDFFKHNVEKGELFYQAREERLYYVVEPLTKSFIEDLARIASAVGPNVFVTVAETHALRQQLLSLLSLRKFEGASTAGLEVNFEASLPIFTYLRTLANTPQK